MFRLRYAQFPVSIPYSVSKETPKDTIFYSHFSTSCSNQSTRNGTVEDPSCCGTRHNRWCLCVGVVWLCVQWRSRSGWMVLHLLWEAKSTGALQRRYQPWRFPGVGLLSVGGSSLLLMDKACSASFSTASETRPTDPDYAQGYKIMFTDCFPFLIASQVQFMSSYFYSVSR